MQNVSTPAHANPPPEEDLISQLEGMESQGPGEATNWVADLEMRYIYDGRRVIQERNENNNPTVSYTRGTDLSGSLEGAGGIGGLLARSHGYNGPNGNWSTHAYYHADGNGNITYMVAANQSFGAAYRYDPYGNVISKSGSYADVNVYRFSSKEIHVNSALYYYLYRFYSPNWQRWLNRDPVFEWGGLNLYAFVLNNPVTGCDSLGLTFAAGGRVRFPYPGGGTVNCYRYACNRPDGPTIPGRGTTPIPPGQSTCANVVAGLIQDHPEAGSTPITCDRKCPAGMHRIAAFANGNDFHFHRVDSGGSWSHKRGFPSPPEHLPPPFDFDYDPGYSDFCGDFCVYD